MLTFKIELIAKQLKKAQTIWKHSRNNKPNWPGYKYHANHTS